MSNENSTTTTTPTTPTRYDLITINNVNVPDVKKGSLNITPVDKYEAHETEGGGKVIDEIAKKKLTGTVQFSGLLQSELQTLDVALDTVSTMTIYNPASGNTKTFLALCERTGMDKIIHDATSNAWSWGFTFEEIGDVVV